MKEQIVKFIMNSKFPCIMAKSVIKQGFLTVENLEEMNSNKVLDIIYNFVDTHRNNPKKLTSLIITFSTQEYESFDVFESKFWQLLKELNLRDKEKFPPDSRVSADPSSSHYSFSLKEEAFFILLLHPDSPRLARRFSAPALVFNLHEQFEELRSKGLYQNIKSLIRKRDELLQGSGNPMLMDFGERSEVFQYTGRVYHPDSPNPLAEL